MQVLIRFQVSTLLDIRPTALRFQFTVRGFSKCDAAFVHYSLFELFIILSENIMKLICVQYLLAAHKYRNL